MKTQHIWVGHASRDDENVGICGVPDDTNNVAYPYRLRQPRSVGMQVGCTTCEACLGIYDLQLLAELNV